MALHVLKQQGYEVACLVTTAPVDTGRTFAHDEKTELIELQGKALEVPVHFIRCTFEGYTESFIDSLKTLKDKYRLDGIAYGDLYLEGHRDWGKEVASRAGLEAIYPLWTKEEKAMESLQTFVNSGYEAIVTRIMTGRLSSSWLGKKIDTAFVQGMEKESICPMGEHGEYHTFVFEGPLFKQKILLQAGEKQPMDTSVRLEITGFRLAEK